MLHKISSIILGYSLLLTSLNCTLDFNDYLNAKHLLLRTKDNMFDFERHSVVLKRPD
eukprot:GAHX01004585.1.p1 GENE.GAHX01004585.1~~GAHX01004585.1.p1  ORF type:complete len:57 (+),score=7.04 GAHX01004585.1:81-251(+)